MSFTIGKLAKQAEVTIKTIHYYQRIGLLDEPDKPVTVIDSIHQPSGTLAAADLCGGHSLTVTVFAWVIAFAIGSVGTLYNRIRSFELWFRRASAVLLVITGIYLAVAAWP